MLYVLMSTKIALNFIFVKCLYIQASEKIILSIYYANLFDEIK